MDCHTRRAITLWDCNNSHALHAMRPSSRGQLWGYGGSSRHIENLSDGEEDFAGQDAQRVGYSAAEDHQRLLAQLQRSGTVSASCAWG